MTKNKILILAILFLLVISLIFLYFYKNNSLESKENKLLEENLLPIGENNPAKEAPDTKAIRLEGPTDKASIKQAYVEYVDKTKNSSVEQTQILDKNGRVIPLDIFSDAAGLKINGELKKLLKTDTYSLLNCSESGRTDYGIILNAKLSSSRDIYQEIKKAMSAWENTLFQDTRNLIFPKIDFSANDLANQKLSFKQGRFRYAEIVLPDNAKSSINYTVVFDSIIISSSAECLEEISQQAETLEP